MHATLKQTLHQATSSPFWHPQCQTGLGLSAEPEVNSLNQRFATIEGIATGTPETILQQSDAAKFAANLPGLEKNRSRIEMLYSKTQIDTRYTAVELLSEEAVSFYQGRGTIQSRMQMYQEHAVPLAEKVARKALQSAAANAEASNPLSSEPTINDSIRLIVFVSSTGFVAPGVDAELIKRLGLRRDTARVTVNFMGCAAAMNGLRVACDHVRAHSNHKALLVCLELSSINAAFKDEINDVLIHSIFGDGCAAVVIGACREGEAMAQGKVIIKDHLSHLIENTEDGIALGVEDNGITCRLSRQLPDYIEAGVGPVIEGFLDDHKLTKESIDLWAVHPGGTRIIQKAQSSLGLSDPQVADSWEILRRYGNMLSSTVLFVMERMLHRLETGSHGASGDYAWQDKVGSDSQDLVPRSRAVTGIAFSFSPGVGLEGILFQKL